MYVDRLESLVAVVPGYSLLRTRHNLQGIERSSDRNLESYRGTMGVKLKIHADIVQKRVFRLRGTVWLELCASIGWRFSI